MHRLTLGWMLASTLLLVATPACAEVVLKGPIEEHLSDAKVAGNVLVGLWLGEPRGGATLNDAHVALPARADALLACVSGRTRDGGYWMQGAFAVPNGPPEPARMEVTSHYKTELSEYSFSDLGLIAELKPDCDAPEPGVLAPISTGGDRDVLVAQVNTGRSVRLLASLRRTGADPAQPDAAVGSCAAFSAGRSTAFDAACRFELPPDLLPGGYQLTLTRLTRAGDKAKDSFMVDLEPAGR